MPLGPGKYDAECTEMRERLKAGGVVLLVIDGAHGSGFAAQLTPLTTMALPDILRDIANEMERSGVLA